MLSTDDFRSWSRDVVLFLHNTSHVEGEPHPDLLRRNGFNGVPSVAFLDASGRKLHTVLPGGPLEDSLKAMRSGLTALQKWQKMKAAVAAGDRTQERELFLLELDMGVLRYADALKRLPRIELDAAEKTRIRQELTNLQFLEILAETPPSRAPQAGAVFLGMYREGRVPTAKQDTTFWQYMFAHATAKKDAALFEELLTDLKKRKPDDARLKRYLPLLELQLGSLKSQQNGKKG